jgi:cyclophilin family peptidyl-prolyl cis-trans isomerase
MGNITVALYNETPLHRANFVKLVKEKFYDGILFHRVIKGFMIQTGDPDSKKAEPGAMYGMGGPGYEIPAEINSAFRHKRGSLAAARNDNPEKKSSGSQFYICDVDNPGLDAQYTVFGETVDGFDVIDKIAATKTAPGDRPLKDVKIISTTLKSDMMAEKAAKSEKKDAKTSK